MLRAMLARGGWISACCALALLWLGSATATFAQAPAQSVTVQYRLLTEFVGTERAGGRIFVSLTNRSAQALNKVTVRLANPALGKVTGPVQESFELAAGETRQLEGEFVLETDVVNAARPLEWIVISTPGAGFAQQTLVRGEVLPAASMDADARTASH
jgi:hypothetical protein